MNALVRIICHTLRGKVGRNMHDRTAKGRRNGNRSSFDPRVAHDLRRFQLLRSEL